MISSKVLSAFRQFSARRPLLPHSRYSHMYSSAVGQSYDTWVLPQSYADVPTFYTTALRSQLIRCYRKMTKPWLQNEKVPFISVNEFVLLAMKYPRQFRNDFWEEVTENRIIVKDIDSAIYPTWFSASIPPLSLLRQPFQVLPRLLPSGGTDVFYCDASPTTTRVDYGGGGVVWVKGNGDIKLLGVVLRGTSSLLSEAEVVRSVSKFATKMQIQRAIIISDSSDLIEILTGRSFSHTSYAHVFLNYIRDVSALEDAMFLHSPREGTALPDALARVMRKFATEAKNSNFLQVGEVRALPPGSIDRKIVKLLDKLERRVPMLRIEYQDSITSYQRIRPIKEEKYFATHGVPIA